MTVRRLLAALAALLAGCSGQPMPEGMPAVIVEPTEASRAELQQVVQTALGVKSVRLAADALTGSSELSIEHPAPRGIGAPPATGRVLGRPELFRLQLDGGRCVLIHERTGLRWLLLDTECQPG